LPEVGSVYETETLLPWSTAVASVKVTVDPETVAVETVTALPPARTAYVLAAAVVADKGSLKVKVKVVPFAERTAVANVGAMPSTTIALPKPIDPEAAGAGKVKVAALPTASFIVPPFSANADADK
jgi:hypothetical protein